MKTSFRCRVGWHYITGTPFPDVRDSDLPTAIADGSESHAFQPLHVTALTATRAGLLSTPQVGAASCRDLRRAIAA